MEWTDPSSSEWWKASTSTPWYWDTNCKTVTKLYWKKRKEIVK
jgi:hypothetical protein